MQKFPPSAVTAVFPRTVLAAALLSLLSACGSGSGTDNKTAAADAPAATATASTTLEVSLGDIPLLTQSAQPSFHVAPVLLDVPADMDQGNGSVSALMAPRQQTIPVQFQHLSARGLTAATLQSAQQSVQESAVSQTATPSATPTVVSTYTPAQIRAAYGLPALPASFTGLTAAQAAQFGAGQTIYIVDAQHNPNAALELSTFNQKFGLPACTSKTVSAVPLAAASLTSCELIVAYNTASGTLTTTAPAYNSGWATEIALDVQWAHATAPLARIVLIEAPDASLNSLIGGVQLANAMGPGVVSMSFGASEAGYTASVDSVFTAAKMTYIAATGDSGAAVSWPAVSSNVLAVSGTSLTYSGTGARTEVAWSGTGGGMSAYTATPAYQNSGVPGMGSPVRRTVADVSFNADPNTGQYLATISPGSTAVSWLSAGGTSMSAPQWAGIIAVANALRAQTAQAALAGPHAMLYTKIASVPGSYASAFADITKGSDGTCATCTAKLGYDPVTGLGTPNVTALLTALNAAAPVSAPVVGSAGISGQVGTALSFTVSASSVNPLTYSLSGAPAGMAINSSGIVTWAVPVAGTYTVTVTASDAKANLSGKGIYTVTIAAPLPPVVSAASISGKVGTALSFTVSVVNANPVSYSMTAAPSGMTISTAGVVTWATPVLGTYAVTVTALDAKTGLSGKAVYTVTIAAQPAPVVNAAAISGKVGTALAFNVSVTASNPLSYSLSGAPSGMTISSAGAVSWAVPVAGTYAVTVVAKDSKTGLSGQGVYTVSVTAASAVGPVITAPAMTGVLGKALTGSISIVDVGASSASISIAGAPLGMSFSLSGAIVITASWATPVTGNYTLTVTVTDNLGRTAKALVPITITAK